MNVIKMLNKQIEAGKDIVMSDGNIISKEEIRKAMLKKYLAGVKAGEIDTTVSFEAYLKENSGDYVTVQDVIDVIEKGFEDVEEDAAE